SCERFAAAAPEKLSQQAHRLFARLRRRRAKELAPHDCALARLRRVEHRRVDHHDRIEGTCDRAVAASDTGLVIEVNLPLGTPPHGTRGTRVHTFRIVAVTTGGRHEVLADLHAVADETAAAMQRFAGADAIV